MKKTVLVLVLSFTVVLLAAQKPTLQVKAFQRYFISGMAPTTIVEMGDKETVPAVKASEPEYFIYLIAYKLPGIKIESVWIKHQLYPASIHNLSCKPVFISNNIQNDTLVRYTDEEVWQISITGKGQNNSKPKKNLAALVAGNELVLRLLDKQGRLFTRYVKKITQLESARGQ